MTLCKLTCELLYYPHANLRLKATPVETVDQTIQIFIDDMFETMYKSQGIGLAATQVNVQKQIITIDISSSHNQPLVLINPEISQLSGQETMEEGCLSLPGIRVPITRADKLHLKALDRSGKPFELDATGLLAVCIQHEIDHLNGKVIIDYLSKLKQQIALAKIKKFLRERL